MAEPQKREVISENVDFTKENRSVRATESHPGRKRLGKELLAHITLPLPPSVIEVVDVLAKSGFGTRSSIVRTLIQTGFEQGELDSLSQQVAIDSAERKPGSGRKRIGRERMDKVSTLIEPAMLERIEQAAKSAGISRSDALRRLLVAGYEYMIVSGYQQLPEYKHNNQRK